jgi:hypothetical protein
MQAGMNFAMIERLETVRGSVSGTAVSRSCPCEIKEGVVLSTGKPDGIIPCVMEREEGECM